MKIDMLPAEEFYNGFGLDYDLMINWDARLRREGPFFKKIFEEQGIKRVLDCACGTGRHAVEFARWGFAVSACDISPEMLRLAERNASKAGVEVEFFEAALTNVARAAGGKKFDCVVCLGNSLPHLLTQSELNRSIRSIRRSLSPEGIFLAQIRNYDRILKDKLRFMPPTSAEFNGREYIFFRMLDLYGPRRVDFNVIRFFRDSTKWTYQVRTTRLRPITRENMDAALRRAGFEDVIYYGDYSFTPFASDKTLDLISLAF